MSAESGSGTEGAKGSFREHSRRPRQALHIAKQPREKEQDRDEQFMEDKKRKKEDKKRKDAAQKVTEQKTKVPDVTKPSLSQLPATSPLGSAPSPPVNGGNNAKRVAAVPNGQATSAARYMPREVPPRFRCQQDHKVLLKRGQPPPASCMLLGGGAGPPSSAASGVTTSSGALQQGDSGTVPDSSPGGAAASNYANSTWCAGASSNGSALANPPHIWDKVIVDGSDMEEWPCIASKDTDPPPENATDNNSASNSGLPDKSPQPGSATGKKGRGSQAQTGSTGSECSVGPWKGDPKAKAAPPSNPPAENSVPGNWRILGGQERAGPGFSNFNPNTNPTAWPALNQDGLSRNGLLDADGSSPDAQLSTGGQLPREQHQQSKVDNAGVNFVIPNRDPAQTQNTDGPKNINTSSLNASSPNPMENKGIPFGAGSGNRSRSTDTPSQSTGERKTAGVGSWPVGRGPPATDVVSGQCNYGNNGRERDDSWKGPPAPKPNGSRSDSWDGNSRSASGVSWGFGPQDSNDSKWCEGNKTASAVVGVSQGEWKPPPGSEDPKIAEWGETIQPNSTSTGAWDNQKSHPLADNQGNTQAPCWGRPSSSAGSETGGQSTGSNHKAGSGDSLTSGRRTHRAPLPDSQVALQTMLSRPDLDPRILSNTGWGQTQIKQDTVWEMAEAARPEGKADKGTEGWEKTSAQSKNTGGWVEAPNQNNQNKSGWGDPSASTEWKDSKNGGWSDYKNNNNWGGGGCPKSNGGGGAVGGIRGGGDVGGRPDDKPPPPWIENSSSKDQGWSERSPNPAWSTGKNGWGGEGADANKGGGGRGWDGSGNKAPPNWAEASQQNEIGTWGNVGNTGNANPVAKGGWDDCKRAQGWSEQQRPPHSWTKQQDISGSWGAPPPAPPPGSVRPPPPPSQSSNWKNIPPPQQQPHQSNSSRDEETSGWEEPSPQSISRKMEIDDGTSAWGDPTSYNYKNVNLWDKNAKGGPGQGTREQNVPGSLNNKGVPSVTYADTRTERTPQARDAEKARQQPLPSQQQPTAPPQQHGLRTAAEAPRWSEADAARVVGIWGKNKSATDNGTSAWGEPTESTSGWGDGDDSGPPTPGWGAAPNSAPNSMKPVPKPMQDGWGENDGGPGPGTRHSSWDEEEEGGVWNSAGTLGSSSSHSAAGWAPGGTKKPQMKGSLKGGSAEPWINPLSKQFSNMGLLSQDDPSGGKMELSVGGLTDKKFETDKRVLNLGDYNDNLRKERSGFRPPNSKDVGVNDNGPYYEKLTLPFSNQDGCLGDEAVCSPFSPSPSYKHSPSSTTLPSVGLGAIGSGLNPQNFAARQGGNHGLYGNSAAQSRGMHTPGQPLNSSPNLRAQGPPQFLPPQVSASILKQFPNNSLNPGLFNMGPQLSPQQIAMLSQLPQIPQFQLACQLLLQQQQQQQHLLQNQRKISQAVRQQQEQQLVRMVNALQQQQRQPGMKHSPSHPVGPKPHMDSGLADLQAKGQMSGFGSGFSSSSMDYGMGGGKEAAAESRFKQWTSMMDGLPSAVSQEVSMHKNGAIVPPGKARGGSPYNQYDMISSDHLGGHPGQTGDSWLPVKSPPSNKIGNKASNASWPPEFQPGVPWKGIQNIDPESDPYVTPGSVLGGSATSPIIDTDHQLLRDNTTGSNSSLNTSMPSPGAWPYSASENSYTNIHSTSAKFTDYKSTWTPDPIGPNPAHLSHKMWKNQMSRNTTGLPRPPPGLSNPKPSSPWNSTAPRSLRGWGGQESRFASASAWSDGSGVRLSYWLVLHNLTPQIDGSTLRTICMQHGPLLTFHLNLTQGTALIRYSTKQEAAKAQTALHMCVLGNTTILAEFATDDEVSRFLAQSQPPTPTATQTNPNAGWQSLETGQSQTDTVGPSLNLFGGSTGLGQWSGGSGGGDLAGASLWGPSSLWGVPSVEDPHRMGSPAPLLPGDLLGGGSDSI
ncbi:trinucleotide repeat-containing gene 6B protein isoform X3 [Ambystoma mexicanum]|uniref:trinucleotide repeat-containing gene 6B protein isoform X3 n=1 Tax=Ambystoma mexicanum TaxID=8296 RepID=UPI0037E76214